MSLTINLLFAVRNFYGKNTQILLSLLVCIIGIVERIWKNDQNILPDP